MDILPAAQNDASAVRPGWKPAVPKKPARPAPENDVARRTRVRDMVRKLQEKEQPLGIAKPAFLKPTAKTSKAIVEAEKDEMDVQTSNQTLEDLKAIDEDIEKLRKQIEERDKIISALREAAEAKDKKLDSLMVEYSKLRSDGKPDLDASPEPSRATSSSPSSPPLCNGELCWTDSFVSQNYHEPVYARLLNDHAALQKTYDDLRTKLESKGKELERLKAEAEAETRTTEENAINLIMAEQIRVLKEREAQLVWEAEELREQNDLMEFRILELEECRKEFLDKEMTSEGKHRAEKIVWRERDFEEVSDSGVMSLPTSEDLTSDSELGEAIRNYSPLGAATALNPLAPESSPCDSAADLKPKKSLKSSECLQESGIFVDSESGCEGSPAAGRQSKACQTESVLEKTLLDLIDSSCGLFLSKNPGCPDSRSDDLSAELSKLSVIQKRIQQRTPRGGHAAFGCPHSNSVLFYEERLAQLEDKLRIYESSGDAKEVLLAKRLQKEVELAHRVKELAEKVASLEASNRKLEEEKCEFEEAENDARFQCQRLEVRLQELIDKNSELELELERRKVIMSEERRREKRKGNLEGLLSKYERRTSELEEKEVEARQRLAMIEAAMPAIVAWNIFRMTQSPEFATACPAVVPGDSETFLPEKNLEASDPVVFQLLEEVADDRKQPGRGCERLQESVADREDALRSRIEELEAKAAKDREVLEEMTNALKALKAEEAAPGCDTMRPEEVDLFEELKQMVANEIELRAKVDRLEKKERAYTQTLEKADEIWAGMEADYKRRLSEAEDANSDLQTRISQLEATQARLEKALAEQPLPPTDFPRKGDVQSKIQELIRENEKLSAQITRSLDEKFSEHRRFLESENASLREDLRKLRSDFSEEEQKFLQLQKELEGAREELDRERRGSELLRKELAEKQEVGVAEGKLHSQIMEQTQELSRKSKELSNLEVTVAELREEVETLEGRVAELVETIRTSLANREEAAPAKTKESELAPRWAPRGPVEECVRSLREAEEILVKKENDLIQVQVQVLYPSEFHPRWLVFAWPSFLRQEVFLQLPAEAARKILVKIPQNFLETSVLALPDRMEDEIFRISLKNTELQQTLERMEEESRAKDRELEELQKLALDIRRELLKEVKNKSEVDLTEVERKTEAESSLRVCGQEGGTASEPLEFPRRSPSINILEIISPIVVKSSEQVPSSLSSLQIAADNLQNKCRFKQIIVKPLLNDVNQKGDSSGFGDAVDGLALEYSSEVERSEEISLALPDLCKQKPKNSSASYPTLLPSGLSRRVSNKSLVEAQFSFVAPITTIRKVGVDGLFLEWDVSRQPPSVTGFEIKVNGLLTHWVRSPSRNKALLHPLNLGEKITIQIFALSEVGRSIKCSQVTYPNEQFS